MGDELIFGERDSNGNERFLLRSLHERGAPAVMAAQLPDDAEVIASFLRYAKAQSWSPIFVAGGLGGTHDDKTREAVALGLGLPLVRHDECFETLDAAFARRRAAGQKNNDFTPQRQRMAHLPEGCTLIDNPLGAPGFRVAGVYAFPGFPSMLQPMATAVLDELEAGGQLIKLGELQTEEAELPVSEGVVADLVEVWAAEHPQLKVGIYPSNAEFGKKCKLVLRYREGEAAADEATAAWRALLGQCDAAVQRARL